jgi:hypothetical protein
MTKACIDLRKKTKIEPYFSEENLELVGVGFNGETGKRDSKHPFKFTAHVEVKSNATFITLGIVHTSIGFSIPFSKLPLKRIPPALVPPNFWATRHIADIIVAQCGKLSISRVGCTRKIAFVLTFNGRSFKNVCHIDRKFANNYYLPRTCFNFT